MFYEELNFTKKFRMEVIFRKKISGEEELSSSKGYAIQDKVSLLETPYHNSTFRNFTKDILYPTYITKIVYK